jgi:hypothetical protein
MRYEESSNKISRGSWLAFALGLFVVAAALSGYNGVSTAANGPGDASASSRPG